MTLSSNSSQISQVASVSVLVVFPFSVVLLIYPLPLFNVHHADFQDDSGILTPFFIAASIALLFSVSIGFLSLSIKKGLTDAITAIGLWAGGYFVINDFIAPVNLTNPIGFKGTESIVVPSWPFILLDVILLFGSLALIWRRRGVHVIRIGPIFAVSLVLLTAGPSWLKFSEITRRSADGPTSRKWISVPPPSPNHVDHPNVYHIILDGFRGTMFRDALQDAGLDDASFDGFVYFPHTRSNYDGTQTSTPSFLTGSLYRTGSFRSWMNSWNHSGLFPEVKKQLGTNIQAYSYGAYFELTQWVQGRRIEGPLASGRIGSIVFHLSLAKAAPSFVQALLFRNGSGAFSRWGLARGGRSDPRLDPFDMLLEDEAQRPARGEYVFSHVYVPHAPLSLDASCRSLTDAPIEAEGETEGGRPRKLTAAQAVALEQGRLRFASQSACAIRRVVEFLARLKQTGHYRDAVIIVHSDHGWDLDFAGKGPEEEIPQIPIDAWRRSEEELDHWTSVLLLIKPSGTSGAPMVTSARSTQLLDLLNTIYDLLGLPQQAPEGRSVMSRDYPLASEQHVFTGFRQWSFAENRQIWLGKDFLNGNFNHYTWQAGRGWKVLPYVPVTWEWPVPQNLGASRSGPTVAQLSWKPMEGVDHYRIEMARGVGEFEQIGLLPGSQHEYVVGDIAADDLYRFRIRACRSQDDCSPYTREAVSAAVSK